MIQRSIVSLIMLVGLFGLGQAQVSMPAFSFYDLEGDTFTSAQLDPSRPVFVMMFDPYCDHCRTQAEHIAHAPELFLQKKAQFVWVTLEPEAEAIVAFREEYFGDSGLDVHFLQDKDIRFEEFFGYTDDAVNIYLFKPDGKAPKYFGKEQNAKVLLNYL
jgi:thiol-disulfide isomerase/thioredoxin